MEPLGKVRFRLAKRRRESVLGKRMEVEIGFIRILSRKETTKCGKHF